MKRCTLFLWIWLILSLPLFAQNSTLFQTAKASFDDGYYGKAYDSFAQFLQVAPHDPLAPQAAFYHAESLFRQGKIAESMPLYEAMHKDYLGHPLGIKALLRMAQFDLDSGFWERAIRTSNLILEQTNLADEAAEALFFQAKAYYGLKDDVKALQVLYDLKEQFPQGALTPNALFLMGNILETQRPNDAVRAYLDILEFHTQHPISTDAATRLFQFYYDTQQYQTLINRAPLLLRFIPLSHQEKATLLLADVSLRENRLAEASRYYESLSLRATNPQVRDEAAFGLGRIAYKQGQYERAALFFSELHQNLNNPIAAQALYFEALSFSKLPDIPKALQRYYLLSQSEGVPEDLRRQGLKEAGFLAYQAQNYDQSATYFVQFLSKDITIEEAQEALLLAECYLKLEDKASAQSLWKSLYQLPDASPQLKYDVGMRLALQAEQDKRFADALSYYDGLRQMEGRSDVLLKKSEMFRQLKQTEQAKRTLQQLTQRYPNSPEAQTAPYLLGWLEFEAKQYESASRYFERFIELRRNVQNDVFKTDAQLRLGDSYYALRRFDAAARSYRAAGSFGEAYAAIQVAKALQAGRSFGDALDAYQQFLSKYPNSEFVPEAWYQTGNIHLLERRNLEAIAAFTQITRNHPYSDLAPKALYGIGSAAFNQKDYEQSFLAYRAILERYPQSDLVKETVDALQESATMNGKPELAEQFLQTFMTQHPEAGLGGESKLKTAEYYFNNENYIEALPRFEAFIRMNAQPELLPRALNLGAQTAIHLSKFDIAETYLKQLLALNPNHTENRFLLVDFYTDRQNFAAALALLLELPDEQRNAYREADLHLRLQQYEQAQVALQKCKQSNDEAVIFDCGLLEGELWANQQKYREAAEVFRYLAGLGDEPKLAQAQFRYAEMLWSIDKFLEARNAFAVIPDRFPDATNWVQKSYLAQAKCYAKLGQPTEARQSCDILLQYFPNSPYATEATTCRF